MTNEEKFYKYLEGFQPDIIKLISVKRRDGHLMSAEEIASDLNLSILNRKDKIINFKNDIFKDFSFESFKFQVCSYIKKAVTWYQCRKTQEKFFSRRFNQLIKTKDGEKSSFDLIAETKQIDHDFEFDKNNKLIFFLNLIKNYSDHLTKNEVQLIDLLLQGKKQKEMAEELGVTHQAVSFNVIRLEEKLRCRMKHNFLKDESWKKISIGNKAMEGLFSCEKR